MSRLSLAPGRAGWGRNRKQLCVAMAPEHIREMEDRWLPLELMLRTANTASDSSPPPELPGRYTPIDRRPRSTNESSLLRRRSQAIKMCGTVAASVKSVETKWM